MQHRLRNLEFEVDMWRNLFRQEATKRAELVDAHDRIKQLEVWCALVHSSGCIHWQSVVLWWVVWQAQLAESQAGALAAENRAFNALQKQRALMTELHVMRGYRLESGTNLETTLSRLDSTDSIFTSKSYALQ